MFFFGFFYHIVPAITYISQAKAMKEFLVISFVTFNWEFLIRATSYCLCAPCSSQCCVYMDQSAGGGVGAVRLRAGCAGPGASDNQRGPGRAPPHRGCGGYCGPGGYTHQLQRRKATHAPSGLVSR